MTVQVHMDTTEYTVDDIPKHLDTTEYTVDDSPTTHGHYRVHGR